MSDQRIVITGAAGIVGTLLRPRLARPIRDLPPPVPTVPGVGPRHLVFHPDGRWFYAVNELDGTVGSYEFDSGTGCLRPIDTFSVMPAGCGEPWAAELRLTPTVAFCPCPSDVRAHSRGSGVGYRHGCAGTAGAHRDRGLPARIRPRADSTSTRVGGTCSPRGSTRMR